MPGSLRRQNISSHDIDYVEEAGPCLTRGGISTACVLLVGRNDIKYEYMFMFFLKNLARKGLSYILQVYAIKFAYAFFLCIYFIFVISKFLVNLL